jgi:hypothetical protein
MAQRHHVTMEVGGWVLLAAAVGWLLYVFFNKGKSQPVPLTSGPSFFGGAVVKSPIMPSFTPANPTQVTTYIDAGSNLWTWDPSGQQWHVSGKALGAPPAVNQVPANLPNDLSGIGIVNGGIVGGGTPDCPCGDVDPRTGELCDCPPNRMAV